MNQIISVLISRDNLTLPEARERLEEARNRVFAGENPEEVLSEEFGLEPDYLYDLLPNL